MEGAAPIVALVAVEEVVERAAVRELPAPEHEALLVRLRDTLRVLNHLLDVANGVVWLDLGRDSFEIFLPVIWTKDGRGGLHALCSI